MELVRLSRKCSGSLRLILCLSRLRGDFVVLALQQSFLPGNLLSRLGHLPVTNTSVPPRTKHAYHLLSVPLSLNTHIISSLSLCLSFIVPVSCMVLAHLFCDL